MDERVLRKFFLGKASPQALAHSIAGSIAHPDGITWVVYIRELKARFLVTRAMAVSLCDAVLAGKLPTAYLQWIGFALETSENFEWNEDDLLATMFEYWAAPKINLELSNQNVELFKKWLIGVESYPAERSEREAPLAARK
ncbi:MAG: hypothetical protein KGL02_08025, partial [Acidobacteriota bacterium]|nr:hypothetical protein [Acidobacteriota bacterium]